MKKLLLTVLICLVAGCVPQAVQQAYENQENAIAKFVDAHPDWTPTYNGGSVRLTVKEGTSEETLEEGGIVSFYYAGYLLSGTSVSASNLFATNDKTIAEASSWTVSDESIFQIETVELGTDPLLKGLENGLKGVRGGEECYILFSGKYAYGKKIVGTIPSKSALVYHITVESITN
ncbi:MAG: FKBP-type peptidyl-prolyl cis-trans isomerase [Bacteroidales bacterium]|nr:FKBP-type peptidyl-prolyl cis-trans isomerase [Bacteroidales bacterium]